MTLTRNIKSTFVSANIISIFSQTILYLGRRRGRCGEGRSKTFRRSARLALSSFTKFVQCWKGLICMAGVCFKRYGSGWTCWICWMEICCVQRGVPGHEIGEERWHVWIAKTFPLFLWNLPNLGERHRRRKVSNWPVSTWSNVHHTGRIFSGFHLCWGGG